MTKNKRRNISFITPEKFASQQTKQMQPPRGKLLFVSCRSGTYLAKEIVNAYQKALTEQSSHEKVLFLKNVDYQFSDSETCARLEQHVGGYDAFIIQCLFDPTSNRSIDENLMAFNVAARALKEHGAKHITAILPYLAYSRQDKPTKFTREATTAKLFADLLTTAGIDRLVSWNVHAEQLHGFYGKIPVNLLSPLSLFEEEYAPFFARDDIIAVAPDVGASKMITHFGRNLNINSAIASKYRPKPEKVITSEIIGDFSEKRIAVVLDDIIGSAGSIYAVIKELREKKNVEEIYLGVSHYIGVNDATEKIIDLHENFNLKEVVITNSIPLGKDIFDLSFIKQRSLSDIFCRTINRIHYDQSVSQLFYQ